MALSSNKITQDTNENGIIHSKVLFNKRITIDKDKEYVLNYSVDWHPLRIAGEILDCRQEESVRTTTMPVQCSETIPANCEYALQQV